MPAITSSISAASGRGQGVADLDDHKAPKTHNTNPSSNELDDSDIDLEARGRTFRSGLLAVSEFQSGDLMQLMARCFTQPSAYCLNVKMRTIAELWAEVQVATEANSDRLGDLNEKLHTELDIYGRFLLQTIQIHALEQPGRKHLEKFLETAKKKFEAANEGGTEFLEGRLDDWILVPTIDKLENFIQTIPNHRIGKLLLKPFKWQTTEDGHMAYDHYYQHVFRALALGIFNSLVSGFVGLPIAIQTLKVTSRVGQVVTYLLCLLCFSIMVKAFVPGLNMALVVTLAYAGILAANMRAD